MLLHVLLSTAIGAFALLPLGFGEHAASTNTTTSAPRTTARSTHRACHYVPIQSMRKCAQNNSSPFIGERSLCTFDHVVDVSPYRVPESITTVQCRCMGVPCTPERGFRCVQVYHPLNATYTFPDGTTKKKRYLVPSDCRCASTETSAWNLSHQEDPPPPQKHSPLHLLAQWETFVVKQ
nr:uncharacterized protein LOC126534948 [Dermacentor andersoni]